MSFFWDRLIALGCNNYAEYLDSAHWREFKKGYRASSRSRKCEVCNRGPIQLHHHTYQRLGKERLDDVTPLCRDHHEEVHKIIKDRGWPVESTRKAIDIIKARLKPKIPATVKVEPKNTGRQRLTKVASELAAFIAIAKEGYWHPIIPNGYQPTGDDPLFPRFLKLIRRAKLKAIREERAFEHRKWRTSTRTVKMPKPDFSDAAVSLRAIAAGFRPPR